MLLGGYLNSYPSENGIGNNVYMGHRAQDGKKVDEMSLLKKKYEAGTDR